MRQPNQQVKLSSSIDTTGYIICATPRSGSNLLCEALSSTGVLGCPLEYMNIDSLRLRKLPDYTDDLRGRLIQGLRLGATPNGIWGIKLLANQFHDFLCAADDFSFSDLHWVYLHRRDFVRQAISKVKADQSQKWRSNLQQVHIPVYNEPAITVELEEILRGNLQWNYFFAKRGIKPLRLVYEEITSEIQSTVQKISNQVGRQDIVSVITSLEIQRDDETEVWYHRYVQSNSLLKMSSSWLNLAC